MFFAKAKISFFSEIDPANLFNIKLLADDVKSGKEVTVDELKMSSIYSYTVEDVNNLLTILPVARKVIIYLPAVPLTSSNLNCWTNLDGQWELITFHYGQLHPDWMSDLGNGGCAV